MLQPVVRVGEWLVTPSVNQISRKGRQLTLEPRLIDLLVFFARHPGEVLSRDELIENVWTRNVVTSHVITQSISELRKSLKDGDDVSLEYIATVPKRGYKLTVPVISNMAYAVESFVEPAFSARVNEAPLGLKGRSKLFAESLESEVALELSRLKLADFVEYSPIKLPIRMRSGALDVQLKLAFSQTKNQPSTLKLSGGVGVHDLNVLDLQERPLLSFKQLDFQLGESDLLGLRFAVERFALEAPEIHARVDREGRVNWLEFFTQALAGGGSIEGVTANAVTYDDASRDKLTLAGIQGTTLDNVAAGAIEMVNLIKNL